MSGVPPDYVMPDYRMTVRFAQFFKDLPKLTPFGCSKRRFLPSWFFDESLLNPVVREFAELEPWNREVLLFS